VGLGFWWDGVDGVMLSMELVLGGSELGLGEGNLVWIWSGLKIESLMPVRRDWDA
jgi:hypothetical protein